MRFNSVKRVKDSVWGRLSTPSSSPTAAAGTEINEVSPTKGFFHHKFPLGLFLHHQKFTEVIARKVRYCFINFISFLKGVIEGEINEPPSILKRANTSHFKLVKIYYKSQITYIY